MKRAEAGRNENQGLVSDDETRGSKPAMGG